MRFLDKHFSREKRLRSLEREMKRLWQAQAAAPVIPLERPYQRGWIKTYVLESRIEHRPDAQFFRALLRAVNRHIYCRDRSFIHRSGHTLVLRPRIIDVRQWEKLAWPASHQRFFKFGMWRDEEPHFSWWPQRPRWTCGYKLHLDWWLREDLQPHLITHQRVALPDVESRLAEIQSFMTHTCGWHRLNRIRGQSKRHWRNPNPRASERADQTFSEQLHILACD